MIKNEIPGFLVDSDIQNNLRLSDLKIGNYIKMNDIEKNKTIKNKKKPTQIVE